MGGRQRGLSAPMSTTTTNDYNAKAEANAELDEHETNYVPVDWKKVLFTPKYAVLWVALIIIGALTALISLKHDQVVDALRPFAEKVRDIPAGWLIFVAVLFVISFPPLFGHELVALLAGVVYGLWIGFGVVSAGTFIGESEYLPPLRAVLGYTVLITTSSRNMVCFQRPPAEKGREDGEDELDVRRHGQDVP